MMIHVVSKVNYNPVVTPQETSSRFISFGYKDAKKVHLPHVDNLIVRFNIGNCILNRVLINQAIDVSLLYIKAFKAIGLNASMLNPPISTLKSLTGDLSIALSIIYLPIKIGNYEDRYITCEETFYDVDTVARHSTIMSRPWQHASGTVPSTFIRS